MMSDEKKEENQIEKNKEYVKTITQLIGMLEQIEDSLDRACKLYPKNKAMAFNIIGSQTQAVDDYLQRLAKEIDEPEIKKMLSDIIDKEEGDNSNIYS